MKILYLHHQYFKYVNLNIITYLILFCPPQTEL